ncbi:hypothetical protein PRUPE_2G076900 [Prunus persica]|uniref:Uncharacterized protein n=1 Tax=Prunus persica TaxID=3760 RepID=A0A251QE05_PRUPE|nr:uncharacterized protein LOC109947595 isoform X2 [Prunus persica]ONI21630.1 hypothetical protein PRUPE_2G076900 [Prunus persica]
MGSTSTTVIIESPEERTEEALKQDEARKLHKELAEKKFLRGTEQVELPRNKKSEATNTNKTNESPATIRGNSIKATGSCRAKSHHVGVFECNNRDQGTGCDIENNEVDAKDSQFVGVFNCGNESKKPNYFNITHLYFVCLVLLCFAMYKY